MTGEVANLMEMNQENSILKKEIKRLKTENENLISASNGSATSSKTSDANKIFELEKQLYDKDKEIEKMLEEVNTLSEQMQRG